METIETPAKYSADPPRFASYNNNAAGSVSPPVERMIHPSMIKQQQKQLLQLGGNTTTNGNATHKYFQQHLNHNNNTSGDSGLDIMSPQSINLNGNGHTPPPTNIAVNFSQLNLTSSSTSSSSPNNNNGTTQQTTPPTTNTATTTSLLFSSTGAIARGSLSGVNEVNTSDRCLRCSNQVYSLERIGPIKGNIYHKTCFKCLVCERQLDLKTYYTNQVDLNDRQIYCQSHAPKSGKGVFGADSIYIHNVLNAPKLDVMQKVDNKPKANIDGSARHIMHAMHAQHLFQMGNRKDSSQMHRFPAFPMMNPAKIKAREELRKAQQALEAKQRAEEDMLLQKFRDERLKEEEKLDKEVKEEWEKRLRAIQIQYEADLKRKRDIKEAKQINKKDLTLKLRREQEDLEKNMTLKRERKREDAKRALLMMEQEATANLVTKHSEEMLKLIKAKEAEEVIETKVVSSSDPSSVSKQQHLLLLGGIKPPAPHPPVRRKRDLYDDPSVFEYIDEQAINVAESEQTSYTELVDQLTYGLVTDLEKVRAIFRWITVKDLNAIEFGDSLSTSDTPLGLLRGIKFGTETYHTLFMRLCSYAGMHCVDIKGHSKSVGYEPGMKIQPGKFTNTWNAVLIDGEWRFVQCNWGARHLVMSKDKKLNTIGSTTTTPANTTTPPSTPPSEQTTTTNGQQTNSSSSSSKPSRDKIKYQYDEHYFLPDPEEFILEFFPHSPDWQLLEQPITLDEFESLPFVRSLFFHYHLDFVNQRQAVIFTNSRGACDIKLRMPDDLKSRLAFHFHLRLSNREDNEINGVKLERYVLHTIQDDLVSFNVHVPQVGDYFIEIFASLVEPDSNPFGQSFKLKCVCKYKIVCEELTQRMHPLPACASGEWGPMKAQRHFGIVPLAPHKNAIVETATSSVELKFRLPKMLKIHGKLHNNTLTDLDKLIKHEINTTPATQYEASQCYLTMIVQLPDEGQYGLDIYARDPDFQSEKRTMSHCCKYLLNFKKLTAPVAPPPPPPQQPPIVPTMSSGHHSHHHITHAPPPPPPPHHYQNNHHQGQHHHQHYHQPHNHQEPVLSTNIKIGPNVDLLAALGMQPLSHPEPLVRVDDSTVASELDLQFKMSKAVDFSFDLKYAPTTSSSSPINYLPLKSTDLVKVKQYGYTICFSLSLPAHKYGSYLFTVYASDDQNRTKNLPAVYTYMIRYTDGSGSGGSSKKSSPTGTAPSSVSSSSSAASYSLNNNNNNNNNVNVNVPSFHHGSSNSPRIHMK